jgi:ABC-type glutathione transport system ATPase component
MSTQRASPAGTSEDELLLHADRVTKVYGSVTALSDFSLEIRSDAPQIVALAGQSGSGKTTAAQIALGFVQPTGGTIAYRGTPLRRLGRGPRKRFRQDVQAVLQDPFTAFNPFYRVRHVFDVLVRNFDVGATPAESKRRVEEAIEFVGLQPGRVLDAFPHQLSGGERQRIMIARACLLRPRLIVADEPVSMVDASLRSAILEVIVNLRQESGISFLYVTHDLSTAYHIADELLVLYEGETVERGAARAVIDDPQHEYTRRLIDSVPVPDPDVRWVGTVQEDAA